GPITLEAPQSAPVRNVSLNRDSTRLVSQHELIDPRSNSTRYEARLWDVTTRKVMWTRAENCSRFIVATPKGEHFATWSDDGINVWDTATGQEIARLAAPSGLIHVLVHPDGEHVICVNERQANGSYLPPVVSKRVIKTGEVAREFAGQVGMKALD